MPLVFREAHAAPDKKKINEEWFVLENTGAAAINTRGLQVLSGKAGQRGSFLGTIDPGFMLQPGEKILVASGSPGQKLQGEPLLQGSGTVIRLALNQMEIARLVYDPEAPAGVGHEKDKQEKTDK